MKVDIAGLGSVLLMPLSVARPTCHGGLASCTEFTPRERSCRAFPRSSRSGRSRDTPPRLLGALSSAGAKSNDAPAGARHRRCAAVPDRHAGGDARLVIDGSNRPNLPSHLGHAILRVPGGELRLLPDIGAGIAIPEQALGCNAAMLAALGCTLEDATLALAPAGSASYPRGAQVGPSPGGWTARGRGLIKWSINDRSPRRRASMSRRGAGIWHEKNA
jgi:hypothetical protein